MSAKLALWLGCFIVGYVCHITMPEAFATECNLSASLGLEIISVFTNTGLSQEEILNEKDKWSIHASISRNRDYFALDSELYCRYKPKETVK